MTTGVAYVDVDALDILTRPSFQTWSQTWRHREKCFVFAGPCLGAVRKHARQQHEHCEGAYVPGAPPVLDFEQKIEGRIVSSTVTGTTWQKIAQLADDDTVVVYSRDAIGAMAFLLHHPTRVLHVAMPDQDNVDVQTVVLDATTLDRATIINSIATAVLDGTCDWLPPLTCTCDANIMAMVRMHPTFDVARSSADTCALFAALERCTCIEPTTGFEDVHFIERRAMAYLTGFEAAMRHYVDPTRPTSLAAAYPYHTAPSTRDLKNAVAKLAVVAPDVHHGDCKWTVLTHMLAVARPDQLQQWLPRHVWRIFESDPFFPDGADAARVPWRVARILSRCRFK
jgi:hypothetical protein